MLKEEIKGAHEGSLQYRPITCMCVIIVFLSPSRRRGDRARPSHYGGIVCIISSRKFLKNTRLSPRDVGAAEIRWAGVLD